MTGVSDDLREYYYSNDPDVAELDTLEFRNPLFLDENGEVVAVRIVNRISDLVAKLEADAPMNAGQTVTFQAAAFTAQRPESSDQGTPTFQLVMANASAVLMPWLEKATDSTDAFELTYRSYLSDDLTTPQFIMDGLTIKSVQAGVLDVTATAGFEDFLNTPFGKLVYTTRNHAGLDR